MQSWFSNLNCEKIEKINNAAMPAKGLVFLIILSTRVGISAKVDTTVEYWRVFALGIFQIVRQGQQISQASHVPVQIRVHLL
jgi:hypothetical protein